MSVNANDEKGSDEQSQHEEFENKRMESSGSNILVKNATISTDVTGFFNISIRDEEKITMENRSRSEKIVEKLDNFETISLTQQPRENAKSSSSKKVEDGFKEALRKVDTKNDKMIELIQINKETVDESKSSTISNLKFKYMSKGQGLDILNYSEGERVEYNTNKSSVEELGDESELSNVRIIKKVPENEIVNDREPVRKFSSQRPTNPNSKKVK